MNFSHFIFKWKATVRKFSSVFIHEKVEIYTSYKKLTHKNCNVYDQYDIYIVINVPLNADTRSWIIAQTGSTQWLSVSPCLLIDQKHIKMF